MSAPIPVEINLHAVSKVLDIRFEDGASFQLPCEYLRVYSPSAEVRGHGVGQEVLQVGKRQVGINDLEQVGHYALKIGFDDGHNSGLYSWEYLYELGSHYQAYWQDYLNRLAAAGASRG
ncbi:DUF971 domain-containing protein [Neisseriaceae bacterium TC5R-5]|nr:DUF971 domain-containing protein [Neisseriaceae bacterium TC5R-5]